MSSQDEKKTNKHEMLEITMENNMSVLVKWLGHASFMVDVAGKIIYLDPHEGEYTKKADLILASHSHRDHCNTDKIKEILKGDTVIIAPADCASKVEGKSMSLKPGESTEFGDVIISAVEAYNFKRFRSPGMPFHPKGLGVGYLITAEGKTIYHAGDTDFIEEMNDLKSVDLALLPSGGTYTMDNPEAAEAALAINPKTVVPMHRWDTDPMEFKAAVEAKTQSIKVAVLNPGEEVVL
jgi:L-ascorbate metabolism protein UlaG (beta-lactamase superfamily)